MDIVSFNSFDDFGDKVIILNLPHLTIEPEVMSEGFTKYHIKNLPFDAVLHHFTKPDEGDLHDHPYSFVTHILKGGYKEEIHQMRADGWFIFSKVDRRAGTSHRVEATTIHRMIELPEGDCWTLVLPEPKVRDSRFWRFEENGSYSRAWHETEWTKG
jgi:hypothetical protein